MAHRDDQAGLLGHANELLGPDHATARVIPTQQSLDADRATGGDVHHGLIKQAELTAVESQAEVRLQLLALLESPAQGAIEHHIAGPAAVLCLVHGQVGVPQQRFGAVVPADGDCDADAGTQDELLVADPERFCHGRQQAVGNGQQLVVAADFLAHDNEFVTAEAGGAVDRPQMTGQPLGGHPQQLVTGAVAGRVVDRLEAVQVDEDHRYRRAVPARPCEGLFQAVLQQPTVGEPRQAVVHGVVGQELLRLPPARDVHQLQYPVLRLSSAVENYGDAGVGPDQRSILVQVALLDQVMVHLAGG